MEFSGQGVSCTYADGVRDTLGLTIRQVARFEVPSAYSGVLSVDDDGVVSASATHWAKAPVTVTNACDDDEQRQVTLYVNPRAAAGELDLGEASRAPLQATAGGSSSSTATCRTTSSGAASASS